MSPAELERRLAAVDSALWARAEFTPELKAICERVAREEGIDPAELREDVRQMARAYAGLSVEAMIERLAAETGETPTTIRAEAAAIAERYPAEGMTP